MHQYEQDHLKLNSEETQHNSNKIMLFVYKYILMYIFQVFGPGLLAVADLSLSEPHTSEKFRRVNHVQQKTDQTTVN